MQHNSPMLSALRLLTVTLLLGLSSTATLADEESSDASAHVLAADIALQDMDYLTASKEYRQAAELSDDAVAGRPPIGVGAGSVIDGAIVDKNCRIGRNVHVACTDIPSETEFGSKCFVSDGIPVVMKSAILEDGWQLRK